MESHKIPWFQPPPTSYGVFHICLRKVFLAKNHETWAEVAGYAATPQRIHVASRRQPPAPHR